MAIRNITIDWYPGHISNILKDVWDFSQKNDVNCTFYFNGVTVKMEDSYTLDISDADRIVEAVGTDKTIYLI